MQTSVFSNLIDNVALLVTIMAVFGFLLSKNIPWHSCIKRILAGLILGVIGVAIMFNPWELLPGIIFDTRSILISITGLFFGSIPTGIVVLITLIYRIYLGGSGMVTGVSVILTSAGIGLAWRYLRKGKEIGYKALELYLFGVLVHIVMLMMMLFLPRDNRFDVLVQISLPVLTIYPLVTVFIGWLLSNQLQSTYLHRELAEREQRLRLSNELANVAVWEYSFKTNNMSRSDNHDRLYGLDWQEKWDINTFLNATHPEDRDYSNGFIQNSVNPGGPDEYQFDFRAVYPDLSVHWLTVNGKVIERDKDGRGIIVRGALVDVTERKQVEEDARKKQAQISSVLENSPASIWAVDREYRLIYSNAIFPVNRPNTGRGISRYYRSGRVPGRVRPYPCKRRLGHHGIPARS